MSFPTEPSADLREAASGFRQIFIALVNEGFTEQQAPRHHWPHHRSGTNPHMIPTVERCPDCRAALPDHRDDCIELTRAAVLVSAKRTDRRTRSLMPFLLAAIVGILAADLVIYVLERLIDEETRQVIGHYVRIVAPVLFAAMAVRITYVLWRCRRRSRS